VRAVNELDVSSLSWCLKTPRYAVAEYLRAQPPRPAFSNTDYMYSVLIFSCGADVFFRPKLEIQERQVGRAQRLENDFSRSASLGAAEEIFAEPTIYLSVFRVFLLSQCCV
jgi:hypothetical protein